MVMQNRVERVNYDLFCNLPSQRLPVAFIQALKTYPKIVQIFGNAMFAYKRDDNQQQNLPAIHAYIAGLSGDDLVFWHNGKLQIDIYLPLQVERQQKSAVILPICEGLLITIKDLVFFYLVRDKMPWIVKLGYQYDFDSGRAQQADSTTLNVPITVYFTIDMAQYYNWLEEQGISVQDTCEVVMDTISSIVPIDIPDSDPEED